MKRNLLLFSMLMMVLAASSACNENSEGSTDLSDISVPLPESAYVTDTKSDTTTEIKEIVTRSSEINTENTVTKTTENKISETEINDFSENEMPIISDTENKTEEIEIPTETDSDDVIELPFVPVG